MDSQIIYQLTTEDVQTVAQNELGRPLTFHEIKHIEDAIAKNIRWYDAVAIAIDEMVTGKNGRKSTNTLDLF